MERSYNKKGDTYYCFQHFARDVNILIDRELRPLGIHADDPLGDFEPHRLPELLTFCAENPEYHIVTSLWDGRLVNHAAPNACCYNLADGDANPRLVAKDPLFLELFAQGLSEVD